MKIDKSNVLETLRHRGQHSRADWVDRELPDRIDTAQHSGILATLNLNPADFADPPSRREMTSSRSASGLLKRLPS